MSVAPLAKSMAKKVPIEVFALLLPALALVAFFLLWNSLSTTKVDLLPALHYATSLTIDALPVLFLSLVSLFFCILATIVVLTLIGKTRTGAWTALFSVIATLLLFAGLSILCLFCVYLLFRLVDPVQVYHTSLAMHDLEVLLFSSLPSFELLRMLSNTQLDVAIVASYALLPVCFAIAQLVVLFSSKYHLRILLLSFFLAYQIALVVYSLIPVIWPDGLYIARIFPQFSEAFPADIVLSEYFISYTEYLRNVWISPTEDVLSVSTFPSLHAAWGLIATIAVFRIRWFFRYAFLVWYILCAIGTFYTLQHFLLDTLAGIMLAFCVDWLAHRLLRLEREYYTGRDWFYAVDFMNGKVQSLFSRLYTMTSIKS